MLSLEASANRRPVLDLAGARRWLITLAATVVSTYALDAIATAGGLLLVAAQIHGGADHLFILAFLASTYVAWGAGLCVNLKENWALLESTGTSTNLLSKAACDVATARGWSAPARKFAAGAGYVGTEFAKEAPYYVGAFGAAILTDSISANDALIFLGGANLGAAVYEYGLAHGIRVFLRRRCAHAYAAFETDWVPGAYLTDYYSTVEPDERRTIAFFVDAMRDVAPGEPVLFFGVGPTLHHVFLAAGKASEIHLGDYLPANLREIERWTARRDGAHDWRPFVRYTLECEGVACPTEEQISEREELARAKITRLIEVDLRRADPLGKRDAAEYGTVISAYCADSVTADRATWETYMRRIAGLVRSDGKLITAALRGSRGYRVGGKTFPSPNVDENDMRAILEPCFGSANLTIEACELAEQRSHGYTSIVLARAQRTRAARFFGKA